MKRKITSGAPEKRLPLPVGNSDWAHVVEHDWHADKTQLISGLLDKDATVALFTRPRRFGKTFALEMLHTFFENTEKSNVGLFRGTKVWQNPKHRTEQGRYPVLHITLKDAKGGDWGTVRSKIAAAMRVEAEIDRESHLSGHEWGGVAVSMRRRELIASGETLCLRNLPLR